MAVPVAMRPQQDLAVWTEDLSFAFPVSRTISLQILDKITFCLGRGEIVAIVGPSGSGKTTFLRLIAGLLKPTSGTVAVAPATTDTPLIASGYVPQGYSVFPWLTVRQNLEYGLRFRTTVNPFQTVDELLLATGLQEFSEAYPKALSGGMKQRVALGRALAAHPSVLLLDEPFSALDTATRREVRDYLLNTIEGTDISAIIVTHDLHEAAFTADRIIFFSSRPSRVLAEVPVPFSRPRRAELVDTQDFAELTRHLLKLAN